MGLDTLPARPATSQTALGGWSTGSKAGNHRPVQGPRTLEEEAHHE
jgi:hypothetical protein